MEKIIDVDVADNYSSKRNTNFYLKMWPKLSGNTSVKFHKAHLVIEFSCSSLIYTISATR